MMLTLQILVGDAVAKLRELPSESIHCCVTSPPYWGLRDYGTAEWEGGDANCDHMRDMGGNWPTSQKQRENVGSLLRQYDHICKKCGAKRIDAQLGLEKTPEEYIAKMVEVFREVKRVLRKDGTLWLNMGDSYASDINKGGCGTPNGRNNRGENYVRGGLGGLKPKDICGIPWMLAFALRADGWYLRSDTIWAKPNPMPESCTDRPTKSHEYIFLLSKSQRYFYDAEAIKEQSAWAEDPRQNAGRIAYGGKRNGDDGTGQESFVTITQSRNKRSVWTIEDDKQLALWLRKNYPDAFGQFLSESRNKSDTWRIATQPYPEAHFATFPEELPKICILSGTSARGCCAKCGAPWERIVADTEDYATFKAAERRRKNGGMHSSELSTLGLTRGSSNQSVSSEKQTLGWRPTCKCQVGPVRGSAYPVEPCSVLDPFVGSGTTGQVALELGRSAILIELSPKYAGMIRHRCNVTTGLALA